MKLIHTSDLHLDSPLTARLTPSEAKMRRRELIESFRRMLEEAVRIGADGVIIAGDLFDNQRVGIRVMDSILGIIEKSGISVFYLAGNHEKSRLTSSGVSIPDNLKIFGEDWTYFEIGDVKLAGRTTVMKNMFNSLSLSEGDKNIVVLHGMLADHSGFPDKIGIDGVENHPIDYLALGHYHTYSETKIGERTRAVYCGTPEGRGFDEVGDKGYVIIDTDATPMTAKFAKRCQRTLHAIPVDISGAKRSIDIEDRVALAISALKSDDLVRVLLVGEHNPDSTRDVEALKERFRSYFFYFEVKDESKLKISAQDYKNDKSLKGEFIRLVMAKEGLDEAERDAIIECGIKAMAGEMI
ncbi:MAG: DNA repair exonuclease [Clostridia bacterium]|nr:DNA repair exonuclease [Clostridia bacterium]